MEYIKIPDSFTFNIGDGYDFSKVLSFFNWNIQEKDIVIDMTDCNRASYQAMSLIILYSLYMYSKRKYIKFHLSPHPNGLSNMWRRVGANALFVVAKDLNKEFRHSSDKPLFFIRDKTTFSKAIDSVKNYTKNLGIEYEKTLRYIISELFYNTLEHGISPYKLSYNIRIPSLVQFCWYRTRNEIEFIVADIGIGIKKHLEQNHLPFESDAEAILEALKPNISGTFGSSTPYSSKDNAGMGLYISNNIIKRLHSDMYIVSGNGSVHVSPTDITTKTNNFIWPGTFIIVKIKIQNIDKFIYETILSEIREEANIELNEKENIKNQEEHYLCIQNYFGENAEIKSEAISYREKYLLTIASSGKTLVIDFNNVLYSPHSFLNALLASTIRTYEKAGYNPYKKIKIVNAKPDIRETIDYILSENTSE
ncbi:DUF4325 domain-containing protein [Bilophila wadsworthia]|uniref:DUF4325 domain-containing protein n=1 Tax=Bilophila wadsworthia TaxID=35833 RepID=UPI00267172C0|nr:DUF4325 domain-containing protein [Bilophila wadsworthia]